MLAELVARTSRCFWYRRGCSAGRQRATPPPSLPRVLHPDTTGLFPTTPPRFLHEEPRGGRRGIDVRLRSHRVGGRDYRTRPRRQYQSSAAADSQEAAHSWQGRGRPSGLVPGPGDVASAEEGRPGGGRGLRQFEWKWRIWECA